MYSLQTHWKFREEHPIHRSCCPSENTVLWLLLLAPQVGYLRAGAHAELGTSKSPSGFSWSRLSFSSEGVWLRQKQSCSSWRMCDVITWSEACRVWVAAQASCSSSVSEKLYNSHGPDLRRALFSLKQLFQVTLLGWGVGGVFHTFSGQTMKNRST